MFQLILSVLVSFSANAFDGQAKTVTVMPDMATKVTMTLPELSLSDLEIKKSTCREATCRTLATVKTELMAQMGDVEYKMIMAWVEVNQSGQPVEPFQPTVLVLAEPETGNRVTMAHSKDYSHLCFGKRGTQSLCSTMAVKEVY